MNSATIIPWLICLGFTIFGFGMGRYSGLKSKQNIEYWKGRGDGWRACEDSIIARAKNAKLKNRVGETMTHKQILETLIQ